MHINVARVIASRHIPCKARILPCERFLSCGFASHSGLYLGCAIAYLHVFQNSWHQSDVPTSMILTVTIYLITSEPVLDILCTSLLSLRRCIYYVVVDVLACMAGLCFCSCQQADSSHLNVSRDHCKQLHFPLAETNRSMLDLYGPESSCWTA